jgi:hypothetical protein
MGVALTSDAHKKGPEIDQDLASGMLAEILEWIEERVDLTHLARVEERHTKALEWEPIDHPPIAFSAPVQEPFVTYPYHEAFQNPTKMLVNELVGPGVVWGPSSLSIVNSVVIRDDFPLQIRANYGVGLVPSLFGAQIQVLEGGMPWTKPLGVEALKRWVERGVPDMAGGLFQRAVETMAYYQEMLSPYPKCCQAIRITQPDLQGPFDIAAQLWGKGIFTAFYDCPEFLKELLDLVAETYVFACRKLAAESTQSAVEGFIYLHFGIIRGECLLKDDSSVMLSPQIYAEFIRPTNEKVLEALGTGGLHWCGNGDQWRRELIDTEGLSCVDWGNPEVLNLPQWSAALKQRRLPVSRMGWRASEFLEVAPTRFFPTGAYFTVSVDSLEQAGRLSVS